MRVLVAVSAAFVLAGCATYEAVLSSQRPPTAAEKAAIVSAARGVLVEPYSIRDAEISNVVTLNDQGLSAVCVTADIENRMEDFAGRTTVSVRLFNGRAISAVKGATFCSDDRMPYQPFPELEALKSL